MKVRFEVKQANGWKERGRESRVCRSPFLPLHFHFFKQSLQICDPHLAHRRRRNDEMKGKRKEKRHEDGNTARLKNIRKEKKR